jgi:CBS domain-containing protein
MPRSIRDIVSRRAAVAASPLTDGGFRHVPVVEGGKVVGIVSARDALEPETERTGT